MNVLMIVTLDGDMSLKIREAQIPIIDDMECMTNVTDALTNPFILPSSSFCAGGRGQQDACQVKGTFNTRSTLVWF